MTQTRRAGVFRLHTWAQLLYAVIDLPWTILAFTLIFTLVAVGAGLTIIYIGIPILLFAVLLARWAGQLQLTLGGRLAGWHLTMREPRRREKSGLWGFVVETITDSDAWRVLGYFL